jgi:hypothetical protein
MTMILSSCWTERENTISQKLSETVTPVNTATESSTELTNSWSWIQSNNTDTITELPVIPSSSLLWQEVTHENTWSNTGVFAGWNYNFPNIRFSYPKNWKSELAWDTDTFSMHKFYDEKSSDSFIVYNHSISFCPTIYSRCEEKDYLKNRTSEEYMQLMIDDYKKNRKEDYTTGYRMFTENNYELKGLWKLSYISEDKLGYLFPIDNYIVEIQFTLNDKNNQQFIDDVMSRFFKDDTSRK